MGKPNGIPPARTGRVFLRLKLRAPSASAPASALSAAGRRRNNLEDAFEAVGGRESGSWVCLEPSCPEDSALLSTFLGRVPL